MQAYRKNFARVYNQRWANFAQQTAPRLRAYYETTPLGQYNRTLLDVCCGTGQLAMHFLDNEYRVTGLDLSTDMLEHARANAAPYVVAGMARFVQRNAANFEVEGSFGLAVSTFDALNHLPDLDSLRGCFASVYRALLEGGSFVFDLNTRAGLSRWGSIMIDDSPEMMIVNRGLVDYAANRAYMHISGFIRVSENLYERFEETAYNTIFDLNDVREALLTSGFRSVRFCRLQDLNTPVTEPENESRIYVVVDK
jgi:SAM-dependent methyltransferase